MFVKCQVCGNVYGSPPRDVAGVCGVGGCVGLLRPHESVFPASNRKAAVRLIVQCPDCGNVYSAPPRKIWDRCGVKGCMGVLDKR